MSESQWWWTEAHRERWQREQIEDLQFTVSGARSETSRIRSQLSRMHGTLESRVDRLSAAFEAFVELSDIRADLAVDGDAALVRHHVRAMLADSTSGRPPELPELPAVAGYWLVPAAQGLHARVLGDAAGAAQHTETAIAIDGPRTRYFLAAATTVAKADLPIAELVGLLPSADRPEVGRAQRLLWLSIAAGGFGTAGRAALDRALAAAIGIPTTQPIPGAGDANDPWLGQVEALTPGSPSGALNELRKRCAKPDTPPTELSTPPIEADPAITPLLELITALVDEGDVPERKLLRRMEELRGLVESGTAPPPYTPWDEPAGTVCELVRTDLFGDAPAPGTRPVAIRAATPFLRTAAKAIAERGRAGGPTRTTARVRGRDVVVTENGPDTTAVTALRREVADSYRPSRTRQQLGTWLVVFGVAGTAIGFAGLGGAAVGALGIVVLIVGVGLVIAGVRAVAATRARAEHERARLDEAVGKAVEGYRAARKRDDRQREQLDEEFSALSETLAG